MAFICSYGGRPDEKERSLNETVVSMVPKVWIVILVLLSIIFFFGVKACSVWFDEKPGAKKITLVEPPEQNDITFAYIRRIPDESTYEVILEKDIFSPERKGLEFDQENPEIGAKGLPLAVAKKIVVYGVMISEDNRAALIGNFEKIPKGKKTLKKSSWMKIGDTILDYNLAGIEKDKIFLERSGKKYEVSLYDKNKPKRRLIKKTRRKAKTKVIKIKESEKFKKNQRLLNKKKLTGKLK